MPAWRTCVVVIARNEAARIGRLLDSVRSHVDDMLVLDTGSDDDTAARAREGGARLAHFRWCDDFSAARNTALAAAAADWHIVLDADEWLINGAVALASLRETPPEFVGTLALTDHFDDGVGQGRLSRILPGHVRYAGRIHEQPVHQLPIRPLSVTVGHDGYLSTFLVEKKGRNQRLLLAALDERPGDAYLWYQLGKDFFVYEDFEAADRAFATAAEQLHSPPAWWPDLVARRLFALKRLHRHADGMDLAEAQLDACAKSPDVFFALGDLLLDLAAERPGDSGPLLVMMEDAWRRCLDIGERPDLPGAVAGRGSHLAAHNLALVLEVTGRVDEARMLRERHPPDTLASRA